MTDVGASWTLGSTTQSGAQTASGQHAAWTEWASTGEEREQRLRYFECMCLSLLECHHIIGLTGTSIHSLIYTI